MTNQAMEVIGEAKKHFIERELPDPDWGLWSEKLSKEAQKAQDDEYAKKLKETDDLGLPPF